MNMRHKQTQKTQRFKSIPFGIEIACMNIPLQVWPNKYIEEIYVFCNLQIYLMHKNNFYLIYSNLIFSHIINLYVNILTLYTCKVSFLNVQQKIMELKKNSTPVISLLQYQYYGYIHVQIRVKFYYTVWLSFKYENYHFCKRDCQLYRQILEINDTNYSKIKSDVCDFILSINFIIILKLPEMKII